MAINDNYGLNPQPYEPGMIADARYTQTLSRKASASIKNGQAAVRDGSDHKVKPVSAAGDVVQGVVRWEATWMNASDSETEQVHAVGDDASIVSSGPVNVHVTVAVTQDQFAYALINGTGFTNVTGATVASRPVGIFGSSTTGAGTAILNVIPGMTAPTAP